MHKPEFTYIIWIHSTGILGQQLKFKINSQWVDDGTKKMIMNIIFKYLLYVNMGSWGWNVYENMHHYITQQQ